MIFPHLTSHHPPWSDWALTCYLSLQEKLQEALKKLRKEQEFAEKLEMDVTMKRTAWKEKVETHKLRIHSEFEQQKNFLVEEEQRQLQKLEKEEREQLRILGETEATLAQRCQALQELISELERRSQCSEVELLQVRLGRGPYSALMEELNKSQTSLGLPSEQTETQSLEFS